MSYDNDLQTYHAEGDAIAWGVQGLDDCPPVAFRRTPRKRQSKRTRAAFRHRREPGDRALRKVCKRAQRNGVRTAPTFRAYILHTFATMPSPDRLRRIVREFAPDLPPKVAPLPMIDAAEMPADWREALDIAASLDRAEGLA